MVYSGQFREIIGQIDPRSRREVADPESSIAKTRNRRFFYMRPWPEPPTRPPPPPSRPYDMSFWKAEHYQEDVCALGDVVSQGLFTEMGFNPPNYHVLVRAVSKDALKRPRSAKFIQQHREGHFRNIDIWQLETEPGYVCLGDVVTQKGDKVELDKYCCVREDLTVIAGESELLGLRFPKRDRHDTQGKGQNT